MSRGFLNLAELGEFTAAAVENDTVSFIAAYGDGSVFTCNPAFCRLTGYSKQEISKMRWPEDFTTAEYRAHAVEIVKGIYCDVAPYTYELELVRKDGSPVPVDMYVHKFCGEMGETQYYYSFITDMTEHKRLENALKKSEAKYRELVENANSIILKMDTDGNIKFFNEFAQGFFGFSLNEIMDKNVIGTIVPLTESSGRDLLKMIRDIYVHPERYINNENENMRSNGERVWVSWTNKAILDDKGKVIGVLCVGNDITALKHAEDELRRSRDELDVRVKERTVELEKVNKFLLNEIDARKQAEKGVAESEEKFRTLVETSPVAVFFHRGISFIYANPAAERITGRSADDIYKMKFWDLFAPEFQELVKERGLARLRGEAPPHSYEVRLQTTAGEKWMRITSSRVIYKGNPAILTIGEDVTQYREALTALDAVLEITTSAFKTLELDNLIHTILNTLVMVMRADTAVVLLHEEAGERFYMGVGAEAARTRDEIIPFGVGCAGTIVATKKPMYVEDAQFGQCVFSEKIKSLGIRTLLGVPMVSNGNTVGVIHVDWLKIHPFNELEQQIMLASAERCAMAITNSRLYTRTVDLKRQAELYMDIMGHDINNLNQVALFNLEFIEKTGSLNEKQMEALNDAINAISGSAGIIQNVRKIQAISQEKHVILSEDLGELIKACIAEAPKPPGRKVTINYTPRKGLMVCGTALMKEAFCNIINNAIKHSKKDVTIDVAVEELIRGGKKFYDTIISDNGPGIPDELKSKIFNRFQPGVTKAHGRGLGLFIVHSLVEQAGGNVTVEDRIPGDYSKGAKFIVSLPVGEECK